MRIHEIPVLIQILFYFFPKKIGIADRREDVVRLHPVVSIVGTQLKEFGKIFVPGVEVDGHCSLSHAQLINRYRGVVYHTDPADDTAAGTLEATDLAAS